MTIFEAGTGADVWMIIEPVHQTKPLLVTIGNICPSTYALMPEYRIEIHDREGMEGKDLFLRTMVKGVNSLVSAYDVCYTNEEDAQAELDKRIKSREDYKAKTVEMYKEYVEKHLDDFIGIKNSENHNSYVMGCVDAIMFARDHRYILDKHPEVDGITEFKGLDEDHF